MLEGFEFDPSPLLQLTPELLETAIGYGQRLRDAVSNQYRNPVCCGCGGQKERRDTSAWMPYGVLCRKCLRRLPADVRRELRVATYERYYNSLLAAMRWLAANPVKRASPAVSGEPARL